MADSAEGKNRVPADRRVQRSVAAEPEKTMPQSERRNGFPAEFPALVDRKKVPGLAANSKHSIMLLTALEKTDWSAAKDNVRPAYVKTYGSCRGRKIDRNDFRRIDEANTPE